MSLLVLTPDREHHLTQQGGTDQSRESQMLFVPTRPSRPSVACSAAVLSRFRGLPQDVAVPSRFRRRESVEKIQM